MFYWLLLGIISLPLLFLLLKMAFKDLDSMVEALVYFFTPAGLSALRGEASGASWARIKLMLVLLAWAGAILGIHTQFGRTLQTYF